MLPTADDGSVPEDEVDVVDEIEGLAVGDSGEVTVDLEAGAYVLICNIVQEEADGTIEAHYERGMRTGLTSSSRQQAGGTLLGPPGFRRPLLVRSGPISILKKHYRPKGGTMDIDNLGLSYTIDPDGEKQLTLPLRHAVNFVLDFIRTQPSSPARASPPSFRKATTTSSATSTASQTTRQRASPPPTSGPSSKRWRTSSA